MCQIHVFHHQPFEDYLLMYSRTIMAPNPGSNCVYRQCYVGNDDKYIPYQTCVTLMVIDV